MQLHTQSISPESTQKRLLAIYGDWLAWERFRLLREAIGADAALDQIATLSLFGRAVDWHRADAAGPATRAAVILSTAGVALQGGRHG